eukprot:98221-Rhodomonas_salina.1
MRSASTYLESVESTPKTTDSRRGLAWKEDHTAPERSSNSNTMNSKDTLRRCQLSFSHHHHLTANSPLGTT